MMAKLIIATVFLWAVCHVTAAGPTMTTLQTNITRAGCNNTKHCWSMAADCDPSVNTSCYFTSIKATNGSVFIELSGPNTGFVALGLGNNTNNFSNVVFVCGNNNSFFFDTASRNSTVMSSVNVSTVYEVQNHTSTSQINCAFNFSTNLTINTASFSLINNTFTIINGTTNGTKLENITTVLQFSPQLDLTKSTANTTTTNTTNTNTTTTNTTNTNTTTTNTTNTNTTTTNTTNTNTTSSTSPLNITRNGCGTTKLCFSNSSCDPSLNSSCFFASTTLKNQTYSYELSGSSNGYIALALTKLNKTYVFVCGNNTSNGTFFFQTTSENNTELTSNSVSVYNVSGAVSKNSSLIQCTFDTNTTFNQSFNGNDSTYIMAVYSGSTNGTQLGSPNKLFSSGTPLNLSSPSTWTATTTAAPTTTASSGNSLAGLWTHALAVLFSAISLHFITSHSP